MIGTPEQIESWMQQTLTAYRSFNGNINEPMLKADLDHAKSFGYEIEFTDKSIRYRKAGGLWKETR